MFSRILPLVLTITVLSLIATFLVPTAADAWQGELQRLDDSSLNWDWQSQIEEAQPEIDFGSGSYIVVNENGGARAMWLWSPEPIQFFLRNGWDNSIRVNPTAQVWYHGQVYVDGSEQLGSPVAERNSSLFRSGYGDFVGYYRVVNHEYDASWTGGTYEPYVPDDQSPPDGEKCSGLDPVCWFQSFAGAVVDGFQSLGDLFVGVITGLGDWIANLIMPRNENGEYSNALESAFNSIADGFTERLGFLLFPVQFFGAFMDKVTSTTYYVSCHTSSGQTLVVPNLMGNHSLVIEPCQFATVYPDLWEWGQALIRVTWIIGLIAFLHHRFERNTE